METKSSNMNKWIFTTKDSKYNLSRQKIINNSFIFCLKNSSKVIDSGINEYIHLI